MSVLNLSGILRYAEAKAKKEKIEQEAKAQKEVQEVKRRVSEFWGYIESIKKYKTDVQDIIDTLQELSERGLGEMFTTWKATSKVHQSLIDYAKKGINRKLGYDSENGMDFTYSSDSLILSYTFWDLPKTVIKISFRPDKKQCEIQISNIFQTYRCSLEGPTDLAFVHFVSENCLKDGPQNPCMVAMQAYSETLPKFIDEFHHWINRIDKSC